MSKSHFNWFKRIGFASLVLLGVTGITQAHDELNGRPHHIDVPANPTAVMRAFSEGKLGDDVGVQNLAAMAQNSCNNGSAGI